jgi:uncharacterized membrane protein YbaN (DUF454 family)
MTDAPRKGHPLLRPFFFLLGIVLTGVGIAGVMTPLWPGTIFLILAAGCFARSSTRLETWLLNHPRYGPTVVAWRQHGAIPRRIKYVAIGSMIVSFIIVLFAHVEPVWIAVIGAALLASALFVGTRPEGPKRAG